MITNTSNNEELLCDICKKYPDNNCSKCNKIKQGIKQGYAKALDDVEKIIDKVFDKFFKNKYPQAFMTSDLQSELKQSLAKLNKEKPDCFLGGVPVKEKK